MGLSTSISEPNRNWYLQPMVLSVPFFSCGKIHDIHYTECTIENTESLLHTFGL